MTNVVNIFTLKLNLNVQILQLFFPEYFKSTSGLRVINNSI